MKVTLLRHGQTDGNLLGQYVGRTDLPLCREGRQAALAVPPRPDVARVYTSCLARARQTAKILYPGARCIPCEGLNEMDFGQFEGKSWRDMEHDPAYRQWVDGGCEAPCPGGEDKAGFTRRCAAALLAVLAAEAGYGADEVHIVAHGGTIMAVMSALARPVKGYFDWPAGYCGGYRLAYAGRDAGPRPLRLLETIRPREGGHRP